MDQKERQLQRIIAKMGYTDPDDIERIRKGLEEVHNMSAEERADLQGRMPSVTRGMAAAVMAFAAKEGFSSRESCRAGAVGAVMGAMLLLASGDKIDMAKILQQINASGSLAMFSTKATEYAEKQLMEFLKDILKREQSKGMN